MRRYSIEQGKGRRQWTAIFGLNVWGFRGHGVAD